MEIRSYDDFVVKLLESGFSMGGGNAENIFAIIPWGWNEAAPYETPVCWHTGDPETDPWQWRMRVLDERNDMAYSKIFFKKSGYITKEWYPYFAAVRRFALRRFALRRGRHSLTDEYYSGSISQYAKRIYEVINDKGSLPLHAIKQLAGFDREDKSLFDRALIELQMKMYITMCGSRQKISQSGLEYGWASTVFCTVENFFDEDMLEESAEISPETAFEKIAAQIYKLNPNANEKKIKRFIEG